MRVVVRVTAFSLALGVALVLGLRISEQALSRHQAGTRGAGQTQWRTMTPHGAIESAAGRDLRLRLDRVVMGSNPQDSSLSAPPPPTTASLVLP